MCLTVMAAVNVSQVLLYASDDNLEALKAEILEGGVFKEEVKLLTDGHGIPLLVCRTLELCYNLSARASVVT